MNIKGVIGGAKNALDNFLGLSRSAKANPYKEAQEALKQSFNKNQADAAARKVEAEAAKERYMASQDLSLPALPLGNTEQKILTNKAQAIRDFNDRVRGISRAHLSGKNLHGVRTTRANMREINRKQTEYDYLQSMGVPSKPPARKVKVRQEKMEEIQNAANKSVGGNSTAGETKKVGTASQSNPNPSSAGDAAEEGDSPGFFRRHWKATAVGSALTGLAATVGVANMMLAGGQQSNSNLYNPYQQQY